MGVADAEWAIARIEERRDECDFAGQRDERVVGLAEETLGVKFPPSYRLFLTRLGAGNIGAEEIFGVIGEDFVESAIPDSIWLTLQGRQDWGLPSPMIVVYFDGGTGYYLLDTSRASRDGEAPVVAWHPGLSVAGSELETIAPDFGLFLRELVEEELD